MMFALPRLTTGRPPLGSGRRSTLRPMKLRTIWLAKVPPVSVTPFPVLPLIRFRWKPIRLPCADPEISSPPRLLPSAVLPVIAVPTKLPNITLPCAWPVITTP